MITINGEEKYGLSELENVINNSDSESDKVVNDTDLKDYSNNKSEIEKKDIINKITIFIKEFINFLKSFSEKSNYSYNLNINKINFDFEKKQICFFMVFESNDFDEEKFLNDFVNDYDKEFDGFELYFELYYGDNNNEE